MAALLKEATHQSGIAMEAAPQTSGEIVVASLKGVSVDAFRNHLAGVIGAAWKQDHDVFRLVRPSELTQSQTLEDRATRMKEVAEGVETLRHQMEAQPAFDTTVASNLARKVGQIYSRFKGHLSHAEGLEAVMALDPESPAGRLAISAVASLGAKEIADVGPGDRIVYSINPTPAQRRLPKDLTRAIQRYVDEQTAYVAALKKLPGVGEWAYSWNPLLGTETPRAPSGLLIATARSPYNDALTVEVKLVGPDGKYLSESHTLLRVQGKRPPGAPLAEGNAKLSERAARFLAAVKNLQGGSTFLTDQVLIAELEHPEVNDPLSYVTADGLFSVAGDDNFLACVPDDGFIEPAFMTMNEDGTLNLGRFSKWLQGKCFVDRREGWLTARPRLWNETREMRVDRAAAGDFFRRARKTEGASLEDMADFATRVPRRYTGTFLPLLAFFLLPDLNAAITDRSIELLRVYGRLNPDQRKTLQSGSGLPVRLLVPASVADLNYLIYRADSPISISVRGPAPESGVFHGSLENEVTAVLPNGIPKEGVLTFASREADAVIPDGGDANGADYQPLEAWSLAYRLVRAENADPADARERFAPKKFRFGHTRTVDLALQLTETISVRADIKENRFPRSGTSVAFEALPESFRAAVEQAKSKVRQQGFPNRKSPPPTSP